MLVGDGEGFGTRVSPTGEPTPGKVNSTALNGGFEADSEVEN